jgi:tRNA-dihydrouridine synthase
MLSLVNVLVLFSVSAVNTHHKNLSIPVTAKFRVFPTVQKTVEYAKMLEQAVPTGKY